MAIMLLVFLALISPLGFCQEDVKSEIPPLDPQNIRELLLFEFEELVKEELIIENVRQLDDRARADLIIKGKTVPLSLICRKTDFGTSWRLSSLQPLQELLSSKPKPVGTVEKKEEKAEDPRIGIFDTPESKPSQKNPEAKPENKSHQAESYQNFLRSFIDTVLAGSDEAGVGEFYFKDEDFKLDNARGEKWGCPRITGCRATEFRSGVPEAVTAIEKLQVGNGPVLFRIQQQQS
jgi:hypothetical protein